MIFEVQNHSQNNVVYGGFMAGAWPSAGGDKIIGLLIWNTFFSSFMNCNCMGGLCTRCCRSGWIHPHGNEAYESAVRAGLDGYIDKAKIIIKSNYNCCSYLCGGNYTIGKKLNDEWLPETNMFLKSYGLKCRVYAHGECTDAKISIQFVRLGTIEEEELEKQQIEKFQSTQQFLKQNRMEGGNVVGSLQLMQQMQQQQQQQGGGGQDPQAQMLQMLMMQAQQQQGQNGSNSLPLQTFQQSGAQPREDQIAPQPLQTFTMTDRENAISTSNYGSSTSTSNYGSSTSTSNYGSSYGNYGSSTSTSNYGSSYGNYGGGQSNNIDESNYSSNYKLPTDNTSTGGSSLFANR